jgi:hypothetical protein
MMSGAVAEEDAVDRIVVEKSQRRMDLMSGETVLRSYEIALGSAPEGDKQQKGDGKMPVGNTSSKAATRKRLPPFPQDLLSRCHRSGRGGRAERVGRRGHLHSRRAQLVAAAGPAAGRWSRGCIAVTKAEIEEIWRLVPDGTPVEIRP